MISDEWDFVTLQQVSNQAPFYDSYTPYIEKIAEYVRLYSPKSKILLHQTWAYEQGSKRLTEELGFVEQHEMLEKIVDSYKNAADAINADGIIPCGEMMMRAINCGVKNVYRDGFHADLDVGRYLLGLTWYKSITNSRAIKTYDKFDVDVSEEDIKIIRELA
ncbi:MAG: hypothetical protein DBX40_04725 [Clostridiales bacterium]|nr:MAG: hypothetical protein DBX40_04725 [Clostridiales bacterium]